MQFRVRMDGMQSGNWSIMSYAQLMLFFASLEYNDRNKLIYVEAI